jgi:ADP-ribosylglycohydrolase
MPFGLKAMFSLIEAGGDTDSNASIIGGMLGAIHGMALFDVHQSLLDGLQGKDKILQAADDFADVCGVE